jgi:hypothetical protein
VLLIRIQAFTFDLHSSGRSSKLKKASNPKILGRYPRLQTGPGIQIITDPQRCWSKYSDFLHATEEKKNEYRYLLSGSLTSLQPQ